MSSQINAMKEPRGGRAQERTPLDDVKRDNRSSWIILIAILASITMTFASFSSAFVDRIIGGNLMHLDMPQVLWLSTASIAISSLFVERARKSARAMQWDAARINLILTVTFGLGFVIGQYAAWQQLLDAGIYMRTNPHSSFFYMLTVLHVLHVLGGVVWLGVTTGRVLRMKPALRLVVSQVDLSVSGLSVTEEKEMRLVNSVSVCATYWHYVGVLWLYLLIMMFFV